jgi:deferrochelatase/peroxidase EfeB
VEEIFMREKSEHKLGVKKPRNSHGTSQKLQDKRGDVKMPRSSKMKRSIVRSKNNYNNNNPQIATYVFLGVCLFLFAVLLGDSTRFTRIYSLLTMS